jgi:hypothetical protein
VLVRRYACQHCFAIVMSVPSVVLRAMRYSASTIALALGLWSHGGCSARAVRAAVSSTRVLGATAAAGWASLRRWSLVAGSAAVLPEAASVAATGRTARGGCARDQCTERAERVADRRSDRRCLRRR